VDGKLFISIAAGLTTKFFEKHLCSKARVVRSMPNMPALIGEGITGICAGKYASPVDLKLAQEILSSIGETVIVKESMIDAVTAVSGSGPAYVFLFVEQWMAAAKKLGFNEAEAKKLVYKTLIGSAHLLEQSEFDAATLRVKVTSKKGTTEAALNVFAKGKFDQLVKNALLAAKKRAGELAK
jgi:pyrroline-5-carboxylate reductase